MIIFPNYQLKEMSGVIYWCNCGVQLLDSTFATYKIQTAETCQEIERNTGRTQPPPPAQLHSWISLNLIESGQVLPLADRTSLPWAVRR